MFLEISQNSLENTCARFSFFNKVQAYFIKKENLTQVFFSCEFWKISKNTFFTEHLRATASERLSVTYDYEKALFYMRITIIKSG